MINTIKLQFPASCNKLSIIIEAGHIYTNEQPTLEHEISAMYGYQLSKCLELFGAEVKKWLFIDDYNPQFEKKQKKHKLDIENYLSSLSQFGFAIDKIIYEADLLEHAKEIVTYLKKNNYAYQDINGKVILNKEKILLYDLENEKYMCSLLDACLYLQKLEQSDCCITVLDKQYITQQKGTLTILKKLETDTSKIFPFFYSMSNFYTHMSFESSSISKNNIYANEHSNYSFVQSAIDLMQIITKLSGSISTKSSLEIEVEKYDI